MVQLDTKTVYSFMDSLVTIDKYLERGRELGYEQLGIMDQNNLYAAYTFLEKAHQAGIQPLLGLDLEVIHQGQDLRLRLLALSTIGYRQLMKISTQKLLGKSDWQELHPLVKDIAVIVPVAPDADDLDLGLDYYIGVFADTTPQEFDHLTLPLHTVRYFAHSDLETLQMLAAIRENISLREVGTLPQQDMLLPRAQFEALFAERFPASLENLANLTADIHYDLDPSLKLPRFNPERLAVEELRERAQAGLRAKGLTGAPYQERLDLELAVIHQMGFDDYFLIVWDLLRFGRSQGYYMGMGRGSAVGSLVAYSLDITGIDPVAKNLLFERFLNVERYTMPDIDIDIPDVYRPEFIRYVRDRYGTMHAAQIVTYSTFGAKQAIRDVFKRFGLPEYELTNITKKIGFRDTLTSAYERNASFRQLISSKLEYQKAFEIAKKIEGNPRQTSIHAAGVVMSDNDLTDYIPLKYGEDMLITQYDAHGVESNGLLKMDFLGLRNLTFVQRMQEAVLAKYGKKIIIEEIDLEDTETLKLFAAGKTKGIFQFEQAGAINLLRRVQPTQFEEVVATTSLNRPGASDYIDNFVKRKHGQEQVQVLDPSLADIVAPTYGIMLYQEQVMQVAQRFGGFSLGKADMLRRAMGKKDAQQMHQMEADFIAGSLALGHTETKAREVFAVMEKFAGYGFNRSHAYAYSALAFQLAYFKTHYSDVFFDIMLNYSSSDYIEDALQFGFEVAKVHLNNIPYHDKFENKKIYLGLKNIKGLPRDLALWIVEQRPFNSVEDFLLRLPQNHRKPAILTPLIQLGLLDIFEPNRAKIERNLEHLFVFVDELGSLFAETTYSWQEAEDYSDAEKFEMEQRIMGVGLSPHPLLAASRESAQSYTALADLVDQSRATILIQLEDIKVIRTKKGEQMAFLTVTDTKKKLDVTLFPDTYHRLAQVLHPKALYYLSGRIQERDGRLQMVLENCQEVVQERFWVQLENHEKDKELARIFRKYPGNIPVILRYEESKETLMPAQLAVRRSSDLQYELKKITMKTIYR